jgi:rhamnose utilization protein RhaD (predicted bifunctional aldolase and dehydrogenase)
MDSRWNATDACTCAALDRRSPDLGLRVYTSRLLGAERALVLHGGGNTSLKDRIPGAREDVLFIKGSGTDLARVDLDDFAAVRLAPVRELIESAELSNEALARAVGALAVRPDGPRPSIETLLHAVLPWKFVDHTHADSVLAITNTARGEAIAREVFGERAPLVPFRRSGFALAQAAYQVYRAQATARTIGLILLHHGVFAFGSSARESYENMLRLVTLAETYLQQHQAWELPGDPRAFATPDALQLARLRARISRAAGFPLLLRRLDGPQWQAYARRPDLPEIAAEGPATPQHTVFVKREPLLGTDVDAYVRRYRAYAAQARAGGTGGAGGVDPAPRVVIDPALGVWAAGINEHYLEMTIDILRQDMEIKTRAAGHDRYRGLPAAEILDAEIHYGGFERRAHAQGAPATSFLGEVVLLCAGEREGLRRAFAARGATVVDPAALASEAAGTDIASAIALHCGGVDMVVADAAGLSAADALLPVLASAPRGGRAVVLAPEAAAAALTRKCEAAGVALRTVDADATMRDPAGAERIAGWCAPDAPEMTTP